MGGGSDINIYNNIDDFLLLKGFPLSNYGDFCIIRFEDYPKLAESLGSMPYLSNYFEISISIGYDVTVTVNNHTVNVKDNNLVFVSPRQIANWQSHEGVKFPSAESISFMVIFKPDFLPFAKDAYDVYKAFPYFNHNSLPVYSLTAELKQSLLDYLFKIYDEYKRNNEDSIEFIRSYLTLFLLSAKRELSFSERFCPYRNRAEEITFNFENMVKHMEHKNRPIGYYAERLSISSVYLSECVKRTTNKTAKQIIDDYFIMEAKSLLKHSNRTISEIAYDLGFVDDSYFVKYFKRQVGFTPKRFRDNL